MSHLIWAKHMTLIPETSETVSVRASGALRGPYPRIVVSQGAYSERTSPFVAHLDSDGSTRRVFAYRPNDFAPATLSADELEFLGSLSSILVSPRLIRVGSFPEIISARLSLPEAHSLGVAAADIYDLPGPCEVHASMLKSGWHLMSIGGLVVPVKVQHRDQVKSGEVRVGRDLKLIVATNGSGLPTHDLQSGPSRSEKDRVQLVEIEKRPRQQDTKPDTQIDSFLARVFGRIRDSFIFGVVSLWEAIERVLQKLLLAPPIALRIRQAPSGDDRLDLLRVSESTMRFLGVESGDLVEVSWGRRKKVVVCLEFIDEPDTTVSRHIAKVEDYASSIPTGFPGHLTASLSAPVRRDLGCGANTVVVVRRRVGSVLRRHGASLSLNLVAAIFASTALDDSLLIGTLWFVLGALALWQIRIPRPPKGLRP